MDALLEEQPVTRVLPIFHSDAAGEKQKERGDGQALRAGRTKGAGANRYQFTEETEARSREQFGDGPTGSQMVRRFFLWSPASLLHKLETRVALVIHRVPRLFETTPTVLKNEAQVLPRHSVPRARLPWVDPKFIQP